MELTKSIQMLFWELFVAFIVGTMVPNMNAATSYDTAISWSKRILDLLQQPMYPRDCQEAFTMFSSYSTGAGVYHIKPDGYADPFEVYCEPDLENVVWTVLERRLDGSVGFNRTWFDYKNGFGFYGSEFWLGLDKIAYLTNQRNYQLRVDFSTESNITYKLHYDYFRITDEWGNYTLSNIELHISNQIRLVNGTTHMEGRVEIYHTGQWGTVCGKYWDDNDASVACRQLGYSDTGIATGNASYSEGTGPIWLENVACSGGEGSIDHCGNSGWGQHNCGHNLDAGMRCITVRLASGERPQVGRVEVYHNGQWGTICDDEWDDHDASVVCRQLGYGDVGTANGRASFGSGVGQIWLDNIACNGAENNIENCTSNQWGQHNCGHSEDAGVICGTVRLVGESVFPREGHVMVYRNGQWGILCRDSWNDRDAAVICRQLGYHVGGVALDSTALVDAGLTWVTDFACTGLENNINDCHSRGWDRQNCNHSESSGVSCSTVRISGGPVPHEGRVEVYHEEQWGTVCDDEWDDVDASVVCLQLGFSPEGIAISNTPYGTESGLIWLDDVNCDGTEYDIVNCGNGGWGHHNCGVGEVAGVQCQTVRLVGGTFAQEGRVEVYHNGHWGTICDDGWDDNDASVVCRQFGYSNIGSARNSAAFGTGTGQIWLDDVSCSGSEIRIEDCQNNGWGQHNCEHGDDAGVHCGSVRLVGGTFSHEGRVELYHEGQWGTICDDRWDDNDASVICRQLGYSNKGVSSGSATFGKGSGQIWIDEISCTGLEINIHKCDSPDWGSHDCSHDEDAGVSCGTVRLVGGFSTQEGRVEVYHDGQWGTICDDGWDDNDASVICRQLGYGNFGIGSRSAKFGQGSDPIWLDQVACSGSEQHIEDCGSNEWGEHDCGHHEDASVSCRTVRLVGGVHPLEGRVEVYHDGQWGTICDDVWDDNDASVICRQLGYGDVGTGWQSARFGRGSDPIWLDDIACSGSELKIENCGSIAWGEHNCGHHEDASVHCGTVRLVGGAFPQEGRIEIYHDDQWGTICDHEWDDNDASVICRQLGYSDIGISRGSAIFGEGSGQIWLDEISCSGLESNIQHCDRLEWGKHNCGHDEDAGVSCTTLRLVGGNLVVEGRVEVYHDGQWGTICDDGWDDNDTSVICRQLGYGDIGVGWQSAKFGVGSGPIWMDDVACSGSEHNIENCRSSGWATHNCGHIEDVSVYCGTVRLVGGIGPREGRVEVYYDGQWGTICDDGWDDNDASVICRQLGYGDFGIGWQGVQFGQGSDPIWLDQVACSGSEQHIEECGSNEWGEHDCGHGEDASVSCDTVRLVEGTFSHEGRVEIYHDGEWGTICDDGWDDNHASVICRQLGHSNVGRATSSANFGEGSGPIWLDGMSCSGLESNIYHCVRLEWDNHDCGHQNDAGVSCGTVRLVGGTLPREGRLEIYHNGSWGTICDDLWDDKDASVACRHLGYGDIGIGLQEAKFGAGSDSIWLDNVDCSGSEEHIEDCTSNDWGEENCEHSEDAGVSCNSVRLVGGQNWNEGRIEVYHNGEWGTICNYGWDDNDASVICRQLGFESNGTATSSAIYGEGTVKIWLDKVECTGNEKTIDECGNTGWGNHNCEPREDAGVLCKRRQQSLV
ncbi:scavenger receptor cysteine-rich domain-containing protein DMBT1-like [Apostichopus japonicus]|uniref:scavenger receptor cysteine-rich domain-containing protein DMBT1-like n=1 Tax=Stichopus japonicus TaxID=307972 RepID=UPI003AB2C73F